MLAFFFVALFASACLLFVLVENKAVRYTIIAFGFVLIFALLAGCKSAPVIEVTPAEPIREIRYVTIPDYLTEPCPIVTGNLVEVIEVARARKAALESCNADKAAIRGIQGTKVP